MTLRLTQGHTELVEYMKKAAAHFQVINKGIVFDFVKEPEGGYTITVPSLPGCISYGKNFEEAIEMIKDAMEGYLKVAKEEGLLISEAGSVSLAF